MKTFYINQTAYLELALLDINGDYASNLTVTYEIIKCLDDSIIDSGSMSEINNIYTTSYIFVEIGEYRIDYFTPEDYEDGFENIIIDTYDNFKADLTELDGGKLIN